MKLELLSPSRKVVSSDSIQWVTLPGELGEMTILPEHASLITNLNSGILSYQDSKKIHFVAVHWGCAVIDNDEVTILTDVAELESEIDLQRAKNSEQEAQNQIEKLITSSIDIDAEEQRLQYYEKKLQKALIRQNIANKS